MHLLQMNSMTLSGNKEVDICRLFLKLAELMIHSNTHSSSGKAKMNIISSYSRKTQKEYKILVNQLVVKASIPIIS